MNMELNKNWIKNVVNVLFLSFCKHRLVPATVTELKAIVSSAQSILISWRRPPEPNGIISHFTVYSQEKDAESEPNIHNVHPWQTNLNVIKLQPNKTYEFWVTASTVMGEGDASKHITAIPSDQVPARIVTFESKFIAPLGFDMTLPCHSIGSPIIVWEVCASDWFKKIILNL